MPNITKSEPKTEWYVRTKEYKNTESVIKQLHKSFYQMMTNHLAKKSLNPWKKRGRGRFSLMKKKFSLFWLNPLQTRFFYGMIFRGFVYPFWGKLKRTNLAKCNFYVTVGEKRADGSGREYPQDEEER